MDNDGIRRRDNEETDEPEAQPTEREKFEITGDLDDLTIRDASDSSLGLTNIGDTPADDWAADTGPTQTGEESSHGITTELADEEIAQDGALEDFERAR